MHSTLPTEEKIAEEDQGMLNWLNRPLAYWYKNKGTDDGSQWMETCSHESLPTSLRLVKVG